MRTHDDQEIIDIGKRICEAAIARGHSSKKSSSGVNISKLAKIIDASNEMTRRYVEGSAAIPAAKIRALADSLRVSLLWLSHGRGPMEPESSVDEKILEECLDLILAAEKRSGLEISNSRKSKLAVDLYKQIITGSKIHIDILVAAFNAGQTAKLNLS